MSAPRKTPLISTVFCAVLWAISSGVWAGLDEPEHPDEIEFMQQQPAADPVPIESIRMFASVYERVRQNFVEPVSDEQLFDNALSGLLSKLDPYSEFLDPQSYHRLLAFTEGDIAHTGLQVKRVADDWEISHVEPKSLAEQVDIQVGDRLLRIDGKSTRNLSQQDIEQLLRGSIGSSVRLGVARADQRSRDVTVRRTAPESHAVAYTVRSDGVVILTMRAFQAHTGEQVIEVLDPLQQRGALRGLILDIRDNPGGLLSSAVEIADYFLQEGLIVSTKGRGEPEQRYQAVSEQRYPNIPIVVLINRYSASAAEVLAGALQDQGRAQVVGQSSYGKGSVQKLWPIEGDRAIKLTVSRYYTPNGRMIEGQGIQPDVVFAEASRDSTQDTDLQRAIAELSKQMVALPSEPIVSHAAVPVVD
ncbi:MAG: S41 family peptidase [Pseudomonadota bacterium]|nr:S41 family peptidase [Pseudomonadota bacterium]